MSKVEIFVGDLVEHESDRMILNEVVAQLERTNRPAVVMANLEVGRQIDLIVALDDLTLVIEAKAYRSPVRGSENGLYWEVLTGSGRWKPIQNALRQTVAAKLALRDRMRRFDPDLQGYPAAALVVCPRIPAGSDIPAGDFKAAVCEMPGVGPLLYGSSGSQWSLCRWRAFAENLRLTRVQTVEAACQSKLAEAELLLRTYLSAFRTTYAPFVDELVAEDVAEDQAPLSSDILLARCARGESMLIRGPSGCGKSLWSSRIGVHVADADRIPLFLYAKEFEGRLGECLGRETAVLGAPSLQAFLAACRRLSKPILLLIDGYNECAEPHRARLTRAAAALCGRIHATIIATSQIPIEHPDLLSLTDLSMTVPSRETKLAIASRQSGNGLSAAARALLDGVRSGLEARILGEVSSRFPATGNRTALFDTYARNRLGASAPAGIHALVAVARLLSERITFSLAVRDLDRLVDSEGLPADIVGRLTSANLLTVRGDRASFGHEMFYDVFAAEAVVRDCRADAAAILAVTKTPVHAHHAAHIVGSIDDVRLQHAVLEKIEDANLFAECAAGACGAYPQAWARHRIDAVLERAAEEADAIAFAIDETCHPAVRRVDGFVDGWTAHEGAVIGALPDEFIAGRQVDRMMEIIARLDRKLSFELSRLRAELADRKIALRSAMFEFCYVHSSDAPAIATLARRLHIGWWSEDRLNVAAQIVKTWIGHSDLSHGQLYVLLMLHRTAWSDGEMLAPFLPTLLRERYRFAPYHLKLDLLHAAHFSWRAGDADKRAIIDALNELPRDQHIFLSSSVIEALGALGALEDSEAEQVEPLRHSVREALARRDAVAAQTAHSFWSCRFDHPYAGAYCAVYDELSAADRQALLRLAGSVASLDGMFNGPLIIELAGFGDRSVAPIITRWLAFPRPRCSMPQDAIKDFLIAHIALARLECELAADRPQPQTPAEHALGACGDIFYWLNRIDLPSKRRRGECASPLSVLARHDAGVAAAVLYELGRCYIGEGLDRLPGGSAPCLSLETEFRGEVAAIFRQCLRFPEQQIGYFAHNDLAAILKGATNGLGRVGDVADLEILRALVASPTLGSTAMRAIGDLEARLLADGLPATGG